MFYEKFVCREVVTDNLKKEFFVPPTAIAAVLLNKIGYTY
jgi:hypothetical protein